MHRLMAEVNYLPGTHPFQLHCDSTLAVPYQDVLCSNEVGAQPKCCRTSETFAVVLENLMVGSALTRNGSE